MNATSDNDRVQRSERHRVIIRAVDAGRRSVAELAELTGISPVTIRRDLADLAEQGAVERVRGGAAPAVNRGHDYPFALRAETDGAAKAALARAVAERIRPRMSVLIDNGTTALAVARELAGTGIAATALSLHAAAALAGVPGNRVIVPGGPVTDGDLSFIGLGALEALRESRFDVTVLGACAADPAHGLTTATWEDARVKRQALASSRQVVFVATADKFRRTAAHRFGALDDIDVLVTTPDAPPDVLHEAGAAGAEVVTVPAP